MNFDVTTFIFEVVNFLALVWLLKRILYRPVLKVVNERQERIKKGMADADLAKKEALQLKVEYESRLSEWQQERNTLRLTLDDELKVERERQHKVLREQLEDERKRAQVLEEKMLQEKMHEYELKALSRWRICRLFAHKVSLAQLEQQLCALLLEDLESPDSKLIETLKHVVADGDGPIRIKTAMPLSLDQRSVLNDRLHKLAASDRKCEFEQDKALIAGIEIDIGTLVLHANLSHELAFFCEANNGSHL